jgi:hypothetical protein
MSSETNTNLLERANELLEEVDSHPAHLDDLLDTAIKSGDLEQIQYWVNVVEGTLAQEYYES